MRVGDGGGDEDEDPHSFDPSRYKKPMAVEHLMRTMLTQIGFTEMPGRAPIGGLAYQTRK